MKKINISTKKHPKTYTKVDDKLYKEIKKYKWSPTANKKGYILAVYRYYRENGKMKRIALHRYIMGFPKGKIVDHKNGDPLDNQRRNLRICTKRQNCQNKFRIYSNTGLKGVHLKGGLYITANIKYNGKKIYLGIFESLTCAAKAYDKAARKYFGKFARTNKMLGHI